MSDCRVKKLYEACRKTFRADKVPPMEAIQTVKRLLGEVTALDLGLDTPPPEETRRGFGVFGRLAAFPTRSSQRFTPPITYLHVHESDDFTLAVFCLPTAATIPLHDHPGMVVLSKLLYGSMHVRSYDWEEKNNEAALASRITGPRNARLVLDKVVTAGDEPMALFPTTGGNIHAFTALTPCAVFDVLAPPYMPDNGRDCTYYSESSPNIDASNNSKEDLDSLIPGSSAILEQCQPPDDFVVRRGKYTGPEVP